MAKESGKAFDFKLFKRLLAFTNAYRGTFYFVAFAAIAMSGLAVLCPLLLRLAIDNAMFNRDLPLLQYYLILML